MGGFDFLHHFDITTMSNIYQIIYHNFPTKNAHKLCPNLEHSLCAIVLTLVFMLVSYSCTFVLPDRSSRSVASSSGVARFANSMISMGFLVLRTPTLQSAAIILTLLGMPSLLRRQLACNLIISACCASAIRSFLSIPSQLMDT